MANETSGAFTGVVPPFASASSSNPSKKRAPCDVFINHRGPDSKLTLATSIYETLKTMGLQVFLDEPKLDLGDSIPSEIQYAMDTSFLHIAILSPKYAESLWCLAELSYMLETGKTVIPVFYNVEIGDIRWGKGVYTDAFIMHKESGRYSTEKLEEWRTALQKVTYRKGYHVKENDDEGKADLLKAIESYVKKHSQKIPLVVADHPVSLEEIVDDFESYAFDSSQDVRIVGIVGMGGCGKTTLAKEYYNKKRHSIYKCSFIPNVKDVSKNNLHKTQREMLQDLGSHDVEKVNNIESGKAVIADYLKSVQVFIVLDDVDHLYQLDSLMPIKHSLGKNSIIIVTSRDSHVLTSRGISCIYKMKKLNPEHAMDLFCYHAFPQVSLIDKFESRVLEFLKVCQGLPLSLKVLGGLVRGKSQDYWDDQLKVASRLLPNDIRSILKVSFDALGEEEKEIFLDICCFFIGEEKELAVTVWDGSESGWNGLYSFTVLESKCLVEVDEGNRIRMHDHLRDLGKEIVLRKEIAKSPYRLWSVQQIKDIELEGQESVLIRGIRGIREETEDFYEEWMKLLERVRKSGRRFERRKLEILIVENNFFTEELAELSAGLVWLRWNNHFNFPQNLTHTTLQPWLSNEKLRILKLRGPSILDEELWSESADPPVQLRELDISCVDLRLIPSSIGRLKHLKKISLHSTSSAKEFSLPEEFCLLQSLEHLDLTHFNSLPNRFGDLTNLRHLNLSDCRGLMMLPASFKQLINLQYIEFSGCSNLSFPPDILENMRKLETLHVSACVELKELPQLVSSQGSLKKLNLSSTRFMELPDSIGQLSKLENLRIGSSLLTALPASIGNLSSLTELQISECDKLKSLPETLEQLTNRQSLKIEWCPLTELSIPLTELSIQSGCFSSSSLCSLKSISLEHSSLETRVSISQQCCPCLESLYLFNNECLVEIDSLPKSVKHIVVIGSPELKRISPNFILPNLESLIIVSCEEELEELPNFAESLSLRELEIRGCGQQLKKIEGLENCRSLELLISHTCWEAAGIQSLENTESLRRVELSAWNISALEPCLQNMKKKWPDECVIFARSAPGVEEVVKSFTFPGLTLVDFKCGQRSSSNEATMLCYVTNCSSDELFVSVRGSDEYLIEVVSGKWVWIGVFTQSLPFYREENFVRRDRQYDEDDEDDEDEDMRMVWIGETNRVVESFYKLLQDLQNLTVTNLQISEWDKLKSLPETLEQLTNLQSLQSLEIEFYPLTELSIQSGCFSSSSLCSLKSISLEHSSIVTRVSISQQCCPCLESLALFNNECLVEIDSLPKSVKFISVLGSPELKRISPNFILPNLESLVIVSCEEELEELPNFAESLSLRELEIRGCGQQLKKIEGLENCRSLELLISHTCWEAAGIQSLENTESLRRVELSAWNISALEPCLQTMKKKWPDECVIFARSAPGVEEVVKSFQTFPGLTFVDYALFKAEDFRSSSNEATMLCYVTNSFSDETFLIVPETRVVVRGKWVWIGVFTQFLPFSRADKFVIREYDEEDEEDEDDEDDEDENIRISPTNRVVEAFEKMVKDEDMGMVWIGETNRVVEAFYELLQHLQNLTLL